MKALVITVIIILAIGSGYLVTTGMTWLCLWLVDEIFGVSWDVNVWLLGLLVFIVSWMLKSIFTK